MIPALSFLVAVACYPWVSAPANEPKWVILFTLVLLATLWVQVRPTWGHFWGACFVAWCGLTLFWTVAPFDSLFMFMKVISYAGVFLLGASLKRFTSVAIAFALGVAISGFLAIPQFFGWDFLPQASPPAGLFMNKNYMAEAAVMALVALIAVGKWKWGTILIPAIALPGSMGAFIALYLTGCLALKRKHCLAGLVVGAIAAGSIVFLSDHEMNSLMHRIPLWANTLAMIDTTGSGIGSYWAAFPPYHDALMKSADAIYAFATRPRTAHNDILTLAAETGVMGVVLLSLFVVSIYDRSNPVRYVFLAFLFLGFFNFPFYVPATGFFAALVAGYMCRTRYLNVSEPGNGGVEILRGNRDGRSSEGVHSLHAG